MVMPTIMREIRMDEEVAADCKCHCLICDNGIIHCHREAAGCWL